MEHLIASYLKDKENAWTPSTIRSEGHRLRALSHHIDGNPQRLWRGMANLGRYSRVTGWTRVCSFWDYLIEHGKIQNNPPGPGGSFNPYRTFREKNARLFKNAYQRKKPDLTIGEAAALINRIGDPNVARKALELLKTGMRYRESLTVKDGEVLGKGEKIRRVSVDHADGYQKSYRTFVRHLGTVGLKPHDLRKILASHLWQTGFDEISLCQVFGWNNIQTAMNYVKTHKDDDLMEKVRKATANAVGKVTNDKIPTGV